MRNFIVVAVFVAVLTTGTVFAEDSKQTEKVVGVSWEEFQVQNADIMATINGIVTVSEDSLEILENDLELYKEVNKLQEARIEKYLHDMTDGREEYRQAIEKYFSSSN